MTAGAAPAPTPPALGAPLFGARLRDRPEDFRVDERLALALEGRGEHLWLRLEKRLLNSADVARLLAHVYAVGSADVGLSGLKDRRSVARQWFSVRTAAGEEPLVRALDGGVGAAFDAAGIALGGDADAASLRLVESARHRRKLRRGTHAANAFDIVLRDVRDVRGVPGVDAATLARRLDARLAALRAAGFPNYVGPQRFGRGGANLERARRWFGQQAGAKRRRRVGRERRGLWLSAARAELFNRVCAARVGAGCWSAALPGEPIVLDGARSFFFDDAAGDGGPSGGADAAALDARLARGDVHPSGPWWGRGASLARGRCAELERAALAAEPILREGLERAGLVQQRRALRVRPERLVAERPAPDALRLSFSLPSGAFATALLAEIGRCEDAPR